MGYSVLYSGGPYIGSEKYRMQLVLVVTLLVVVISSAEKHPIDLPFLMTVETLLPIAGKTLISGKVKQGKIKVGDTVEIVGIRNTVSTTCTGIARSNGNMDEARAGDYIGVYLQGISRRNIERGQVLAKPGSITPHGKFQAHFHVLSEITNNYRAQFLMGFADITGILELPEGVERAMPGDEIVITVELVSPLAFVGSWKSFIIVDGSKAVGYGVVSQFLD